MLSVSFFLLLLVLLLVGKTYRPRFDLEGEGEYDNAVRWYPPLMLVFVFLPLQAGFSTELLFSVVTAIALSSLDLKSSESSPSFPMTIC